MPGGDASIGHSPFAGNFHSDTNRSRRKGYQPARTVCVYHPTDWGKLFAMTATRTRRRLLLPLVGCSLLAAAGGAGWATWHFGWLSSDQQPQPTADAGVAETASGDLASQLAAAWSDAASEPARQTVEPNEPTQPAALADAMPPAELDLPALDALPSLDALPAFDLPVVATSEVAADNPTAESASATVARGQSPAADHSSPPNPLRGGQVPRDSDTARRAFAAQQVAYNAPPEPSANIEADNPLRAAATAPAEQRAPTSELPSFDGEALGDPLAGPPAMLDELPSVPTDFAPLPTDEFPAQPHAADEPLPMTDAGNLAPIPLSEPSAPLQERAIASEPRVASRAAEPTLPPTSFSDTSDFDDSSFAATAAPSSPTNKASGRPGERALEGPQRPALVMQKFAPDEIQVGKECKFIIKVRNMGQRPADNVVVYDHVPDGTKLVATTPQAEQVDGQLAWRMGTLSPGEEREMQLTLLPHAEGEIGSVATVTFAAQASAKTQCTRPQLALRMTAPQQVMLGRQQRITIELHNPGTGDATGVMLLQNVPDNLRHEAGPALEFDVGTLRAGETRRLELVMSAIKAGAVHNVLTARADGNLQAQQHVDFDVIAPALAVDVEGPARRYLERPATYTVRIDNPGSAAAKDVQLVTQLPRGMQFVKANNMGEYDPATHSVYWSLAELPAGQTGTVEVTALPTEAGEHTIEVRSRAREGLEDATARQVTIEGLPAIMFEVHDLQDPIEVGGNTAYEIRVVNQGTKAATNIAVRVVTPPGMKVVSATGETRHQIDAQGVVFEPLRQLAPKADTLFRVQLQGVQAGDQRVLVEVDTDDLSQPVRKEESTRVFGDE
jgi:uncharacterized repeat protein (TIGR01451 family)